MATDKTAKKNCKHLKKKKKIQLIIQLHEDKRLPLRPSNNTITQKPKQRSNKLNNEQ